MGMVADVGRRFVVPPNAPPEVARPVANGFVSDIHPGLERDEAAPHYHRVGHTSVVQTGVFEFGPYLINPDQMP